MAKEATATETTEQTQAAKAPDLLDQILEQAQTFQERSYAFKQMTDERQRRAIAASARVIGSQSWGKNASDVELRAVARYALELGTDPARHWELMGGRLYDTAELWMDAAAAHPQYDGYDPPAYINDDERLSEEERTRRRDLRAMHCMPDAPAVCVVHIWRKDKSRPFIGANHAGAFDVIKAKTGKVGTRDDPVGGENPGKTAFTRAFRRAAKTAFPLWFASHALPGDNGVDITQLKEEAEAAIREDRELAKKQQEEYGADGPPAPVEVQPGLKISGGGQAVVQPLLTDDPYNEVGTDESTSDS